MSSGKNSTSSLRPSPAPKLSTSSTSAMLTASELDLLRQQSRETGDSAQRAFQGLRPKQRNQPKQQISLTCLNR
jgi:hypothetical protein